MRSTVTSVTAQSPQRTSSSGRRVGIVPTALIVAARSVRKFMRTSQLILFSTVQGVLFLVLFRYVFGGAIAAGGLHYVDFLVPGGNDILIWPH